MVSFKVKGSGAKADIQLWLREVDGEVLIMCDYTGEKELGDGGLIIGRFTKLGILRLAGNCTLAGVSCDDNGRIRVSKTG